MITRLKKFRYWPGAIGIMLLIIVILVSCAPDPRYTQPAVPRDPVASEYVLAPWDVGAGEVRVFVDGYYRCYVLMRLGLPEYPVGISCTR